MYHSFSIAKMSSLIMGLLCLKFEIIIIVEASHYLNSVILFCKLKLPLLIQNTVNGKLSVLNTLWSKSEHGSQFADGGPRSQRM